MKRFFIMASAAAALMASAQFFIPGNQRQEMPQLPPDQKLRYAEKVIETYYVDSVNSDKVVTEAINAMLKTLDPHSSYSDPEETRELTIPLEGNFSGIGIQFNMLNDTLFVIQTTSGGPSEKVGILPGDRILQAGDSVLSGVKSPNSRILRILRGPKGTEVALKVLRKGVAQPLAFNVIRDDIPVYSVDASYMADPTTGYIRISRFAESTNEEFEKALAKLRKEGMKNLIIDLEDNGGGFLNAATDLASHFLQKGDLIVYTDAPKLGKHEYLVEKKGDFTDGKVVVMANQYSASASEILSGALQDNDRGLVVGRRTFGKGLVQRPFPIPDGSMIRLTVSRYYTPSGRCIQKDYSNSALYDHDILDRYNRGEMFSEDSIKLDKNLLFHTVNGRTVYGGGGIMPDIFVPNDTSRITSYYLNVANAGLLQKFAFDYVDANRERLEEAKDVDELLSLLPKDDRLLRQFVNFAAKNGIAPRWYYINISHDLIVTQLKALIARDTLGYNDYFRLINEADTNVTRAVQEILEGAADIPVTSDRNSASATSLGASDKQ